MLSESRPTLHDPMDCTIHEILQVRILEWVAFPFFREGVFPTQGSNQGLLHCRQILYQLSHKGSPRTMELVPIPSPEDLPNPGLEQGSPSLQVDSLLTELSKKCTLNIYKFICHLHFNQARKEKKDTISLY